MTRTLLLALALAAPAFQQSAPALPQSGPAIQSGSQEFPKTVAEARSLRAKTDEAIEKVDREATKRGLEALDEGRVLRGLSDSYAEIESLLADEQAFEAEQRNLPNRRETAQADLAKEQQLASQPPAPPPEPVDGVRVARMSSEVERARIAAAESESAIAASERLLSGGDVRQREAARADLAEIERRQRELDSGRSSLGPKSAAIERERISLRRDLDRRSLLLHEKRAFQAQSLVEVQRLERDAKELAVDRLSRQLDGAVHLFTSRIENDLRAAKQRLASVEAERQAVTEPWEEARLDLDVEAARSRADAQEHRLASVRGLVDPALSARISDVRSRLSVLRQQFGRESVAAGDADPIDAYFSIEEMRRSKAVQDFEDELSDLHGIESDARDDASEARRRARALTTSLEVRKNAAMAQLGSAIADGKAPADAKAKFESEWNASAAALTDAIQARARAATRLTEATGIRERSIRELLDTLSEAESIVRSKGFFLRVGSQIRIQSLRDALLDAVTIVRELPRFTQQSLSATGAFVTDRANIWLIAIGAVLFPAAIVLMLFTRRVALRLAAVPKTEEPTLVDRARLLGFETARRAAGIGFSALAAVVAAHLFFSHRIPTLVRAVDAAAIVVVLVRVARVVVYALFRPDAPSLRLVPASDGNARYIWRIVSLASWAVLAVDVPRSVLAALGYKARNSGFMELLSRVEQGLLVTAVVLFFLRQSVLEDLLPHGRAGPWRVARRFVLQLRPAALFFAIAIFVLSLLGYRFLADYLESISLGGVAIAVLTSLGFRTTLQLWERFKGRLPLGPQGSTLAARRLEFLNGFVRVAAIVVFAFFAYEAFVVVSGTGVELLRSFDSGVVGGRRFSIADAINFLIALVATGLVSGWIKKALDLFVLPLTKLDLGTRYAISTSAGYLVLVVGALVALAMLGFELRDFTILLGAAGFGIGLGMQEPAANFLNGLILLFSRHVKVGDVIESEGQVGQIVDITITTTRVVTPENHEILIPNREIVGKRLVNRTGRDPRVRASVKCGVAYGTDLEKARASMLGVAKAIPDVLADPPPEVFILDFADSSILLELRMWTPIHMRFDVETRARFDLSRAFAAAGIEIPFPQRDLNVRRIPAVPKKPAGESPKTQPS